MNGLEIIKEITEEVNFNQAKGWYDEGGAYHDSGWNESWPDGWRDSH